MAPVERLPEGEDRDLPEPRPGRPEGRLPGPAIQDRRGLRGVLGEGAPRRHAEPAPVPPRPAHRLHPGGDRRGVGLPRRDPRPGPFRRDAAAMFDPRAGRARPGRRVPDPRAFRNDVFLGHGQRLHDDRPAPDGGNPSAARLLRWIVDRHDPARDRVDSGSGPPPLRQRMRQELLVNATPPETRVAVIEDGRTVEVLHERRGHQGLVGNVYLGRVHRILPGMHAAFVSIGLDRDAFLYVEDVLPKTVEADGEEGVERGETLAGGDAAPGPARIEDLLREGQDIVVQVTKDPLGGKGPRVTSNLALAGRTLVGLPGASGIGVSRRITDEAERERLRRILEGFGPGSGWVARTGARGGGGPRRPGERRPPSSWRTAGTWRTSRPESATRPEARTLRCCSRASLPSRCAACATSSRRTSPRSA